MTQLSELVMGRRWLIKHPNHYYCVISNAVVYYQLSYGYWSIGTSAGVVKIGIHYELG